MQMTTSVYPLNKEQAPFVAVDHFLQDAQLLVNIVKY